MVTKLGVRKATDAVRRRLSVGSKEEVKKPLTPDIESRGQRPVPNFGDPEKRKLYEQAPRYEPTDWDDSLPYGGKVYLARRKKPDTFACFVLQIILVAGSIALLYYGWFHTDHLHFHATKLYAKMGHMEAQAIIGHKLLHGRGVEKNHEEAMIWLHEAAKQGHPESAYNVAVGHLQGIKTGLQPGDARRMIQHAADNGVDLAMEVLVNACTKGKCDE